MKYYVSLLACLASLMTYAQSPYTYRVEGELKDDSFNGKTLHIMRYDDNRNIDSARVENRKFAFEGEAAGHAFCRIDAGRQFANFILDEGTARVDFSAHKATGTPLNTVFGQMETTLDSIRQGGKAHMEAIKKEKPDAAEWMPIWKAYHDAHIRPPMQEVLKRYILANKENGIGECAFRNYSMMCSPEEMDTLLEEAGDWLHSLKTVQRIKARFAALKNTAVGKPFADLAGEDTEGKAIRLSDFVGKGKYVLADMWASWCAPCREEIPNLAEIHRTYKDKGLIVVGIATWDRKERILKAIKELNMTWPQLLDSRQEAMKLYGVDGIPHIILFAPDGTIVARNLRGAEMKLQVAEVMNEK